jgi:CheY-like chemotaxis protein
LKIAERYGGVTRIRRAETSMEAKTHGRYVIGLSTRVAPDGRRIARVLHVENNKYVFRAIKAVMSLYEFAAIHNVHCPDLPTAVGVLGSNRNFDLIMTDHAPPTVDGTEVIRVARSLPHRKHIPVLMLASVLDDFPPIAAVGADAFLCKPPDLQELKETVAELLKSTSPPTGVASTPV